MFKRFLIASSALLAVACASREPAPAAPAPEPVIVTEAPPVVPAEEKPVQGDGPWSVSMASERTAALTQPWVQRFMREGYRVTVDTAEIDGTTWHRVLLPGYTLVGARAMLPILAQQGVANAWIVPRASSAVAAAPAPAPVAAPAQDESMPPAGEPTPLN